MLVVGLLCSVAAGCSSAANSRRTTNGGAGHRASGGAVLASAPATVSVVTGKTPSQVLAGVSKALFASAPAVVVAGRRDHAGTRKGAAYASQHGMPLLLVNGGRLSDSVRAEIARLHPKMVLAVGKTAATVLSHVDQFNVVTNTSELPTVTPPTRSEPPVVLISADDRHGDAIRATATAAGAKSFAVADADPRSDAGAITYLAHHPSAGVIGAGSTFDSASRLKHEVAIARTGVQLPGGGQRLFPGRRLIALYGHPGTGALGVLGEQGLAASIARAKKLAKEYQPYSKQPTVATFEIIATVADSAPGADGNYSAESTVDSLRPWVEEAGRAGLYVVLDLQPGRANLLDQAKRYKSLLKLPYVGLAVDPEWKLSPDQVPMRQIGGVDASEINAVSTWLSQLVTASNLPQKLLVLHQFQLAMIRNEDDLKTNDDGVQVLIHMDGQGAQATKNTTWASVKSAAPVPGLPLGWKNFYDEDHPMLTPQQTMQLKPTPLMISYQ